MGFSDQLSADLSGVFFSDFGDDALVDGSPVRGRFTRIPHEFSGMGGSVYCFEAAASLVPSVKKNSTVTRQSDGRIFTVLEAVRENDIVKLML